MRVLHTNLITLGTVSREETAVILDFVQITFPPILSPQFGHLVQFFSNVKIQDLKVSLGQKIIYKCYNILYIYTT